MKHEPPKDPHGKDSEKLELIRAFILKERMRSGVTELRGPLPELSCIAFGEFHNLLWRELMHIPEREWHELEDPQILDGVYKEVLKILEKRRCLRQDHAPSLANKTA